MTLYTANVRMIRLFASPNDVSDQQIIDAFLKNLPDEYGNSVSRWPKCVKQDLELLIREARLFEYVTQALKK